MCPTHEDKESHAFGVNLTGSIDTEEDSEVHSSGLSPAAEEVEPEEGFASHRGIIVYDYDAVSVDDFFDLEEASA